MINWFFLVFKSARLHSPASRGDLRLELLALREANGILSGRFSPDSRRLIGHEVPSKSSRQTISAVHAQLMAVWFGGMLRVPYELKKGNPLEEFPVSRTSRLKGSDSQWDNELIGAQRLKLSSWKQSGDSLTIFWVTGLRRGKNVPANVSWTGLCQRLEKQTTRYLFESSTLEHHFRQFSKQVKEFKVFAHFV